MVVPGHRDGGQDTRYAVICLLIAVSVTNMATHLVGLLKYDFGAPLAVTASRAKGYDMGLVAVLE